MKRPRMIFQTQGAHFAQFTLDTDLSIEEIETLCSHHFAQAETPGTYLTTILRPDNSLLTYHSNRRGF